MKSKEKLLSHISNREHKVSIMDGGNKEKFPQNFNETLFWVVVYRATHFTVLLFQQSNLHRLCGVVSYIGFLAKIGLRCLK